MKYGRYYGKLAVCVFMILVIALSLTTATYAWFASNSVVRTDHVISQTDTDTVELLVSETGGDAFHGGSEAVIARVNNTATEELMPVSTADLKNFVYNAGSIDGMAVHFTKTEDEYYYHGRIFLRADAVNHENDERLALYLDESEEMGPLFRNATGNVLNAVRLGLTFDGETSYIFRVSEEQNSGQDRVHNTKLNGVELGENQVIDSSHDTLQAVADPSVPLEEYMLDREGTISGNTSKPLLQMELNRIYTLDIYVYLEGCDPDCSEVTQLGSMDFYLAFYGILTKEGS